MNIEQIRKNAPSGATHTLMYDGCLYYFKEVGVHMYQYLYGSFSEKPFSCSSFYNFKPPLKVFFIACLSCNISFIYKFLRAYCVNNNDYT